MGESEDKINTSFEIIRQENPRAATRGFSICVIMDTLISFAYTHDNIGESFFQVYYVTCYFFSSVFFTTFSVRI